MSGTILRRRDRTARPPRVEHYSSAVNRILRDSIVHIGKKAIGDAAESILDKVSDTFTPLCNGVVDKVVEFVTTNLPEAAAGEAD